MTSPVEDEFTQLVDADIPRVDLVDKAANGTTFLIAKQADGSAGLMDPAVVRELIGKSEPEPEPRTQETVTMTGSPGAIARLIHEAAIRKAAEPADDNVTKAKYNADDRKRMAGNGQAMKDGSYPIADKADLDNAIHAVGRGGADHDAIRRHIVARAKSLGASSKIPDNWAADGSLKEGSVSKVADGEMDEGMDGMDPTVPLACPDDEDTPGDPTDPGSPAWEAIDAATAQKWTAILARARSAIDLLSEREMLEAASADPDDADNACDLQDACCAIDYAISVLAPFAVAEQAEADCGGDEMMNAVGKALNGFDTAPLDTIEALGYVAKAGRSLSAANEQAIRDAVQSLQKVLASLPAPETKESGQAVAKEETDMPHNQTSAEAVVDAGEAPMMGTPDVVGKADAEKTPMVAVYDQKGRLVGIVDPSEITPISGAEADDSDDTADDSTDDGSDDTDDSATETPDLEPAPAAEVGTPADAAPSDDDNVTKTETTTEPTDDTTSDAVLKSSITELVKGILDDHSATQNDKIAKTGGALLELADLVETLKGQVEKLEEQPAEPKVFTRGAGPTPQQLRGQDNGARAVDVTKAREMKQTLYRGTAAEQNQAAIDMQTAAIEALSAIHQRRQ